MGLPIIAPIDDRHALRPYERLRYPCPPPAPRAARIGRWTGGVALLGGLYLLSAHQLVGAVPILFVGGWTWLCATAQVHQARGGWRDW